jgi:hypothetical protein
MATGMKWEQFSRKLDGYYGSQIRPSHGRRYNPPTDKQVQMIYDTVQKLEDNGVRARWIIEQDPQQLWKLDREIRNKLARQLISMLHQNDIRPDYLWEYVNLCREKSTGKKIKYRTKKRFAAPVGYEFIGQLERVKVEFKANA